MTPQDVVAHYFDAIRARDTDALRAVFAADAVLVTMAGTIRGRDEIAAFYTDGAFTIEDLHPDPGPLLVDGDRVAVEIDLRMSGTITEVGDVFTITGDHVQRLAVYLGPSRPAG